MADSRLMRQSARLFLSGVFHAKEIVEKLPIQNYTTSFAFRLQKFITTFNKEFKKYINDKK